MTLYLLSLLSGTKSISLPGFTSAYSPTSLILITSTKNPKTGKTQAKQIPKQPKNQAYLRPIPISCIFFYLFLYNLPMKRFTIFIALCIISFIVLLFTNNDEYIIASSIICATLIYLFLYIVDLLPTCTSNTFYRFLSFITRI